MAKKDFKVGITSNIPPKTGINNLISSTAQTSNDAQSNLDSVEHISSIIGAKSYTDAPDHSTEPIYIRQTFIIREDHMELLKDLTYLRKKDDFLITQKEVLEDILDQYFKHYGEIPKRPDRVKALEKTRSQKIKQGKTR